MHFSSIIRTSEVALKIFKFLSKLFALFITAIFGDSPYQSLLFNIGLSLIIVLLPTRIQSNSVLNL